MYKILVYCCLILVYISGVNTVFANPVKENNKAEKKMTITCYYISEFTPDTPGNIFTLNELPQTIEFTDEIGENHGGGTCIKGHLIENGKVILIEVQTGNSFKKDSSTTTNTTIRQYYIDSNVLPRKICGRPFNKGICSSRKKRGQCSKVVKFTKAHFSRLTFLYLYKKTNQSVSPELINSGLIRVTPVDNTGDQK